MIRVLIALMFVILIIAPSLNHARFRTFADYSVFELPGNAQYVKFKYDEVTGLRHFIYETGEVASVEPDGDQTGIVTNFTTIPDKIKLQTLHYGFVSFGLFENNSLDPTQTQIHNETVYDDVFPYQYNFQIDTQGNVHTTFVSNYTLYYAKRSPGIGGTWSYESVFNNSLWYSMMPDIYLGVDDLPRIVFSAVYRADGVAYVGQLGYSDVSRTSRRSIQYTYATDLGGGNLNWTVHDVTQSQTEFNLSPSQFHALNPGIFIHDGITYVTFNGDYPVAVSSRLEMVRFPEITPEGFNFTEVRHDWIFEAATRSTKFRTPSMAIIDGAFMCVTGTSITGGAMVFMLPFADDEPLPTQVERKAQWKNIHIENERRSLPIISIQGFFDSASNQFIAAYSYYVDLNRELGTFNNDVFLISIQNIGNEAIGLGYERVSDTFNIQHGFGSPILTAEGSLEVFYLEEGANGGWNILLSTRLPPAPSEGNSEYGFALALIMMVILISGSIVGIKKFVPLPNVDQEILPHLVNLRDEISTD